mgnify:FL=1
MNSQSIHSRLKIHLTNITGLGATKLLESLLPSIEMNTKFATYELYLPCSGSLSEYQSKNVNSKTFIYKRILLNPISRFIECIFSQSKFNDGAPILVLGDIPLKITKGNQVLFLQSPLLVTPWLEIPKLRVLKYLISKLIFFINHKHVDAFIVQTSIMKEKLLSVYPIPNNKIHIISQPVPVWIKEDNSYYKKSYTPGAGLDLIYPAAYYPHKNHALLSKIESSAKDWPVSNLGLTIPIDKNPAPNINWIICLGQLNQKDMLKKYHSVDAMLFLSIEESFGFPLIEAMYLDLPIICPDLPFARVLCGDEALYFDPNDIDSLKEQILLLDEKLKNGWMPNWKIQLQKIPNDWKEVSDRMIALCI